MSSQTRDERGDANRLDFRTLVIASVSSAVAAIVVSRIWASGTPIAAAVTPVLVTLFREALDRPSTKIAERLAADTRVRRPAQSREPVAARTHDPVPAPTGRERRPNRDGDGLGDVRVYRPTPRDRITARINPKIALITGLLAFLLAGIAITAGQLLAGDSLGSSDGGAIILGKQRAKAKPGAREQDQPQTAPQQQQGQPPPQDQPQTTPQQEPSTTAPSDKTKPPAQTAPQATPKGGSTPPPTAPPASP